MKSYPSITDDYSKYIGMDCIGFEKLDGSNLRFEWNNKKGWYKYGSRTVLLDKSHKELGYSITLFNETLADSFEKIILKKFPKIEQFIVYCEYFGPNSFAGEHCDFYHQMKLVPIDISLHKKGFLTPLEYWDLLRGYVELPRIVYEGILTEDIIYKVKDNNLEEKLNEGVVFKGNVKKVHDIWMCKVKTNLYLAKLKVNNKL